MRLYTRNLYFDKRNTISTMIVTFLSGAFYSSIIISSMKRESLYIKRQNEEIIERLKNIK